MIDKRPVRLRVYAILVAVLLLGTALRFWQLDAIPPGMTHDEAAIGFFVRQTAENTGFRIDAPYGYANEPFTKYSATPFFAVFGARDWTLRAHQAFWGLVGILAAYLWVKIAFGVRPALAAAALMAVSYWPLTTSRMALNSNPTPALVALAAYFVFAGLGLRRSQHNPPAPPAGRWYHWLGLALALGFSLNTYEAARSTALVFPAFAVYLAVVPPARQRLGANPLPRFAAFIGATLAGFAIGAVHLANPAAWGRTSTLSTPLLAAQQGNIMPLVNNVLEGLATLFIVGDPFVVYNLPGRPNLSPLLLGALCLAGIVWCVWHWRQPRAAFALFWLGAGLAPTLAIGAFTAVLHSIAGQVIILALPAIGTYWLLSALPNVRWRHWGYAAFALMIAYAGVSATHDYFNVWAQDPGMRAAYFANFGELSDYINEEAPAGVVAISSAFPDYPHDPLTYDMRVHRSDITPRWFDSREALLIPAVTDATLLLPVNAYPDPWLARHLPLGNATRIAVNDPIDPWFELAAWQPLTTRDSIAAAMTPLQQPVNFEGAVTLQAHAYDIRGDQLLVITLWQVNDPAALGPRAPTEYDINAKIFVHLLNNTGDIVAQHDTLQAPASSWVAGDTVVQLHRLQVPPGVYTPRIGIYRLPQVHNLRTDDGEYVLLPAITIPEP